LNKNNKKRRKFCLRRERMLNIEERGIN